MRMKCPGMKGIFRSHRHEAWPKDLFTFLDSDPRFKGISARMFNYWYKDSHLKGINSYYVATAGTVTTETIKKYIEGQRSK